jgi:hypothetical protein
VAVILLLIAAVGVAQVVGLARLLRLSPRLARQPTGLLLAVSHSLIMCGWLALSPFYIAAEWASESPYGDVFVPYLLVPGTHIYHPASVWFEQVAFPWLLGHMESFPASVICVIIGPGLVGLVAGGLQWYALGAGWDRLAGRRSGGVESPSSTHQNGNGH